MPISSEFKTKAGEISDRLRALTGQRGVWTEDLEMSLSTVEFSDEQMAAIEAAATPTCLQDLGDGFGDKVQTNLAQKLTHAFKDPVQNSAMIMRMCADGFYGKSDQDALVMMTQARIVLRDIVHNYPLMLGEELPGSVKDILSAYEADVLPRMDEFVEALADGTGLNPDDIAPCEDWQHLHMLPDDVFQGEEPGASL